MLDVRRQVLTKEHERINATFLAWHRTNKDWFFSTAFSRRRGGTRTKKVNVVAIILAVERNGAVNGMNRRFYRLVNQIINRWDVVSWIQQRTLTLHGGVKRRRSCWNVAISDLVVIDETVCFKWMHHVSVKKITRDVRRTQRIKMVSFNGHRRFVNRESGSKLLNVTSRNVKAGGGRRNGGCGVFNYGFVERKKKTKSKF